MTAGLRWGDYFAFDTWRIKHPWSCITSNMCSSNAISSGNNPLLYICPLMYGAFISSTTGGASFLLQFPFFLFFFLVIPPETQAHFQINSGTYVDVLSCLPVCFCFYKNLMLVLCYKHTYTQMHAHTLIDSGIIVYCMQWCVALVPSHNSSKM